MGNYVKIWSFGYNKSGTRNKTNNDFKKYEQRKSKEYSKTCLWQTLIQQTLGYIEYILILSILFCKWINIDIANTWIHRTIFSGPKVVPHK